MEKNLSIAALWSGLGARLASNGFQCGLLSLLAFLPIGGLALLSPDQTQIEGGPEFILAAAFLSRLLTPPVATIIVAYLARRDGLISNDVSLYRVFKRGALASVGLVLAVAVFSTLSGLLLVIPGVAFALASCVVLPVMVVEEIYGPQAVTRSWELTREHRWAILAFWTGLLLLSVVFLAGLVVIAAEPVGSIIEPLPVVQRAAFLPVVLGGAFLYGVWVISSFQIYTCLRERIDQETP